MTTPRSGRRAPLGVRWWIAAALVVAPATALAADPCEGIKMTDGTVATARRLLAQSTLAPADEGCVRAVGAALAGRGGVRSVTVAVRVSDAQRADGTGSKIGARYASLLAEAGVPEARISTVVPAAAHGEEGSVKVTFTERRAARPVARVDAVDGGVRAGPAEVDLQPVARGATLKADTYVATDATGGAWLELADGSRLRLGPNALLFIGKLHLNDDLERVVKLELKRGTVDADVRSGGQGSVFDVGTRSGVAGVRGTLFRLATDEGGTRVETLEGQVDLVEGEKAVPVPAGQGLLARPGTPLGAPVVLLGAPQVEGPLKGALAPGTSLRWRPVAGAASYRVELARDAEFSYGVQALPAPPAGLAVPATLAAGKWFWRVAPVDGDGFVGRPSKVYAFVVGR